MLRVFVQGGGCSGLQYGFEFDEQIQDGDTCVENQGVKLLVDPMSVQYLSGAEIDYREGLDGAQFVIRNPQRHHHLRLRLVVPAPDAVGIERVPPAVTARSVDSSPTPAPPPGRSPTSSRRSTSDPTVFTWWSRAIRTASWSSSIACARWCAWPPASTRTAASTRTWRRARSACLERFGQRLRDMHADSVRVVGTNALRLARRKQAFLERAREALGHPIEIISGMEEARLIYSGVAHTMPNEPGRRLVVDIGGGSTELIIGEGLEPLELESLQMGCVSLSERFFGDGQISAKRIERARLAARLELEPMQAAFRRRGWDTCAGSSGTVRAIGDAIRELDPTAAPSPPRD